MAAAPRDDVRFRAVFEAAPDAMLLADDDRRYLDANQAALRLLQRSLDELRGLRVEDISPAGMDVSGAWAEFLARGQVRGEHTVLRPDGSLVEVDFHATAHVTPGRHLSILRDVSERKQAERERDRANSRLQEAYQRVNHIALTLQRAMLPAAVQVPGVQIATRYRPASDALAIGGDWYDVVALDERRLALTVGDVMGHGLAAAGMMGQLRSALAAALLGVRDPARALDIVETYARSLPEHLMATAFAALLDLEERTFTYSNAGHLPPLLVGGSTRFLDEATAPPLTAAPVPGVRTRAVVEVPPGTTLLLYTDGLVERREEDIDEGLARLAALAGAMAGGDCERLAEHLLAELRPGDDDVAFVVLRS